MMTIDRFAELPRAVKRQHWREYQKRLLASIPLIADDNLQSFRPMQPYGIAICFRDMESLKKHCEIVKRKCR